jgi:hypothetical protein
MQYIKIHSQDNVAVALADMTAGSVVTIDNDLFHHLAQQRDIRRRFAGRHPTADHLAQNAAEVFDTSKSIRRITSRSRWRI